MLIVDVILKTQSRSLCIVSDRLRVAASSQQISFMMLFILEIYCLRDTCVYDRGRKQEHLWILKMNEEEISGTGVDRPCVFDIPSPIFQEVKEVQVQME